jgi:type II secretory pathway component PulF
MFVVPKIVEIFQKEGAELPLMTRILIGSSNFMLSYWPLLLIILAGIFIGLRIYYRSPKGRDFIDKLILKLPIAGELYKKVYTAQVATTLSTLLSSGVEMLTAIDITRNLIGNVHVVKALNEARDGVREGKSLARELNKSKLFPSLLIQMIGVGERGGRLEQMLQKAGKSFENDSTSAILGLTTLIEPIMIVGLGTFVLGIVISVLLPMFSLMDKIQG